MKALAFDQNETTSSPPSTADCYHNTDSPGFNS